MSGNERKPNSAVDQSSKSAARRLRVTPRIAAAESKRRIKSRDPTASKEFAPGLANPNQAAVRAASSLTHVPALVSNPVLGLESEGSSTPFSSREYTRRISLDQEIDWRIDIMFMPRNDPTMTVELPGATNLRAGKLLGPVSDLVKLGAYNS